MSFTMEQAALGSQRHEETDNFSLREWALKANTGRDSIKSRRHSASHIRSFREEANSFRSISNISSTVSSPGYAFQTEEIDPATYSFTTALKALRARSGYGWEWLSPDSFALNSKWSEAEKYICNPLSGEFPVECLSAKTLSGRSFTTSKPKATMSGPLVYPFRQPYIRSMSTRMQEKGVHFPFEDKEYSTKDAGTQSTPEHSPTPASTPIRETCRSSKACSDTKFKIEIIQEVAEMKKEDQTKDEMLNKCQQGKCLPMCLWMRKKKKQENPKSSWKILICRTKE